MKKLQLFTGGHKYRNDDIKIVQDGLIEALNGVCKSIGLNTNTFIMQGCTWTSFGPSITVNAGFIYHNGEIYPVDAHNCTITGNTLYWVVETEVLPPSPVTYGDLSTHDCHIREKMVLYDLIVPPIGTYALESATRPFSKYVGIIPAAGVVIYSGSISNFDGSGLGLPGSTVEGWALCNGSNGTPNLKGKFVVGYDSTDTDYNAIDGTKTGGSKTKDLRHRHEAFQRDPVSLIDSFLAAATVTDATRRTATSWSIGSYATGSNDFYPVESNGINAPNPAANKFFTNNPAGGVTSADLSAQDIRPPYFTLAYIMKL